MIERERVFSKRYISFAEASQQGDPFAKFLLDLAKFTATPYFAFAVVSIFQSSYIAPIYAALGLFVMGAYEGLHTKYQSLSESEKVKIQQKLLRWELVLKSSTKT